MVVVVVVMGRNDVGCAFAVLLVVEVGAEVRGLIVVMLWKCPTLAQPLGEGRIFSSYSRTIVTKK